MNIEVIREYCMSKKAVTEEFPFDELTLTFKVLGKIFLITGLGRVDLAINLKCDPVKAIELREFDSIQPGYHMNKKHWNTLNIFEGELSDKQIFELIDHSYNSVINSLPKSKRAELVD